jgi:hypothetical protein
LFDFLRKKIEIVLVIFFWKFFFGNYIWNFFGDFFLDFFRENAERSEAFGELLKYKNCLFVCFHASFRDA